MKITTDRIDLHAYVCILLPLLLNGYNQNDRQCRLFRPNRRSRFLLTCRMKLARSMTRA